MLKIQQDSERRVFDVTAKFPVMEPDELSIQIGGETIQVFDVPPTSSRPPRNNPDGSKTYKWVYGNDTYWLEIGPSGCKMSVCIRGSFPSLMAFAGKSASLTVVPVVGSPITVNLGTQFPPWPTFAMWF